MHILTWEVGGSLGEVEGTKLGSVDGESLG